LIFENHHEALISQDVFDTVQKLRKTVRRTDNLGEANPLTGILWCADCGAKMYNHRRSRPRKDTHKPLNVYHCATYQLTHSKFDTQCTAHHISTDAVNQIILDVLKKTTAYVREHENEFVEKLRASSNVKRKETAKSYQKQISKNERRIADLEKIFLTLYEDRALGKLQEERFDEMISNCEHEKSELKAKNLTLQSELDEFTADNDKAENFIALVQKYTRFEELTTPMLFVIAV